LNECLLFTIFSDMVTARLLHRYGGIQKVLYLFFWWQAWHSHIGTANGLDLLNVLKPVFAEQLKQIQLLVLEFISCRGPGLLKMGPRLTMKKDLTLMTKHPWCGCFCLWWSHSQPVNMFTANLLCASRPEGCDQVILKKQICFCESLK
jgi:hypothetical protein